MIPYYNGLFMFYPFLPPNCNKPPTIYTILESIVNPDVDLNSPAPKVKIKDLAKAGRQTIFNFDYPLTSNITKEKFETMILNHFLQRRIGFETVTAFRIQLDVKLNEIMPLYNKMFDALENWQIFNDGEVTTRTGKDNRISENTNNRTTESTNNTSNELRNHSTTSTNDISDRRNSDLPQNQLEDLRNGSYVTNYNYDTNTNNGEDNSTSQGTSQAKNNGTDINEYNGTDINEYNETITRTPADKIAILKEMQENIKSIYTLIFKDLECLFYQLV